MFLQFLFFTFIYFIGYWDKNSKIYVPSIIFHFNAPVLFLWSDKKRALSVCSSPGDTPAPVGRGATPRYPPPLAADLVTDPSTDQAPGECCPATEQHPRDRKHLGSHVGQPGMKQRTKVVTGPHVHLTWGSKTELGSTSPASSGPGLSGECSELHINSPRHRNPLPGGRERRSAWFMSLSSQPGSGFWCHV